MLTAEGARRANRLLEIYFGKPPFPERTDPIDGLILAILSQNTTDKNRDRAFRRLKERFPRWEEITEASQREIEEAIRPAGLSRVKSGRIVNCLKTLGVGDGTFSLDALRGMSRKEAEDFLTSLPGVGLKTARCVLLFQLGIPAFPVDTHILRVSRRLGWIPKEASAVQAHQVLQNSIPEDLIPELHLNMIKLGRTHCRPRNPRCGECPLLEECPTGKSRRVGNSHGS